MRNRSERFTALERHSNDLIDLFLPYVRKITDLPDGPALAARPYREFLSSLLASDTEAGTAELSEPDDRKPADAGLPHGDPGDEHVDPNPTARQVTATLVYTWLTLLTEEGTGRVPTLDAFMVPPESHGFLEQFFSFPLLGMSWHDVKVIMTDLRKRLPSGQALPDDALAIVRLCAKDA